MAQEKRTSLLGKEGSVRFEEDLAKRVYVSHPRLSTSVLFVFYNIWSSSPCHICDIPTPTNSPAVGEVSVGFFG